MREALMTAIPRSAVVAPAADRPLRGSGPEPASEAGPGFGHWLSQARGEAAEARARGRQVEGQQEDRQREGRQAEARQIEARSLDSRRLEARQQAARLGVPPVEPERPALPAAAPPAPPQAAAPGADPDAAPKGPPETARAAAPAPLRAAGAGAPASATEAAPPGDVAEAEAGEPASADAAEPSALPEAPQAGPAEAAAAGLRPPPSPDGGAGPRAWSRGSGADGVGVVTAGGRGAEPRGDAGLGAAAPASPGPDTAADTTADATQATAAGPDASAWTHGARGGAAGATSLRAAAGPAVTLSSTLDGSGGSGEVAGARAGPDRPSTAADPRAPEPAGLLAAGGPTAAAPAGATASASEPGALVRLGLPAEPADFGRALALQMQHFVDQGVQEARLQLLPEGLGTVAVRIVVDGAQAQIDFHAAQLATRQALEASLPALAASLQAGGLTLSGGGVFDGREPPAPPEAVAAPRRGGPAGPGATAGEAIPTLAPRTGWSGRPGGLDLYA